MHDVYERIRTSGYRTLSARLPLVARCIDMHTGGEPLRVIIEGLPTLQARTVLDARREMLTHHDHLRKLLMHEPRGHMDMYGCALLPPERPDSHFGILFMHNEGYSTMCGHATIAIANLAVRMGWVPAEEPLTPIRIDAPCGQLKAWCEVNHGGVGKSFFDNVPSFVQTLDAALTLPDGRHIRYDLAYGGAFYAFVDAEELELDLSPSNIREIVRLGMCIKDAVAASERMAHPYHDDLNFLYGTIFTGPAREPGHHSRNVCVFADGQVDRSATGSGVSARAAIHFARGDIETGERLCIESITGSTMDVAVVDTCQFGPYQAVIPRVWGEAWICGFSEFVLEEGDAFPEGFVLG